MKTFNLKTQTLKAIGLLLFGICSSIESYGQFSEDFEGTSLPNYTTGVWNLNSGSWLVRDNGIGPAQSWGVNTGAQNVYAGLRSAYINREGVASGNAQDFLVTPQIVVPNNGQLRFWCRQTLAGNQGSNYSIEISTTSQTTGFTNLQSWTETTMNSIFNAYEEKKVSIPSNFWNQPVFIAFVMTNNNGDRWLVDNVSVVEQCFDPTNLSVSDITETSATLSWGNPSGATQFEVEVVQAGSNPTGFGIPATSNTFQVTGLTQATGYYYYVKAQCTSGQDSEWIGPFSFSTVDPSIPTPITGNIYNISSSLTGHRELDIDNKRLDFRNNNQISSFNVHDGYVQESILGVYDEGSLMNSNLDSKGFFSVGTLKSEELEGKSPLLFFGASQNNNWMQSSLVSSRESDIVEETIAFPLVLNPIRGNVGIGNEVPNNKLEITSDAIDTSGLRFTYLTSNSPAERSNGLNLSVDGNGDVILVEESGTGSNNVNIYTADGTLEDHRFVNVDDKTLNIDNRNQTAIFYPRNDIARSSILGLFQHEGYIEPNIEGISLFTYGSDSNRTNNPSLLFGTSGESNWMQSTNSYRGRKSEFNLALNPVKGNVGIGNEVPRNKVEITSDARNTSGLRFTNLTSNSAITEEPNGYNLTVNRDGDVILVEDLRGIGSATTVTAGQNIQVVQNASNYSISSPSQVLSIDNGVLNLSNGGGSVVLPQSINIDTDDQTLSILGNVLTISEGNSVTLPVSTGNNANIYTTDGVIGNGPDGLEGVRTVTLANNNIVFNTSSTTNPTRGKIYIGSLPTFGSPSTLNSYNLFVENGILTEKVKVALRSSSNWADYVFAKDYKLMSLSELEKFISENKHLPGINSATELVNEGLDLGEMQAKQMEKIEELTLYIIKQNKDIEELKAQVKMMLENK